MEIWGLGIRRRACVGWKDHGGDQCFESEKDLVVGVGRVVREKTVSDCIRLLSVCLSKIINLSLSAGRIRVWDWT